jgi:hypothetical protein
MQRSKYFLLSCFVFLSYAVPAQDIWSLADSLQSDSASANITTATFKTTRLINFHTLETLGRRTLDFRISHRFGPVNSGSYDAWGIDGPANIRLGLEYSYDGRLMFGIGRSSYEKLIDGFVKYRWLRQDDKFMPLSVTLFAGAYYTAQKDPNASINGYDIYEDGANRFSYNYQAIIGRKFSSRLSLQMAPWMVHYNLVERASDENDVFGIAFAGRFKFAKRQAITFEYGLRLNDYSSSKYYDSMGIGYEIETGGHVFQVHVTNSFGITENQYFPHTESSWSDGGIRIGFNISRVFTL